MLTPLPAARSVVVLKIGGSVLTDLDSYASAARFVARRREEEPTAAFVVVVSAQAGQTDALFSTARTFASDPDPAMVDLLWSTGELRSVVLLTLALQACGVRATGANVHEMGLAAAARPGGPPSLNPLKLRSVLVAHEVVVVPGFLARGSGDRVVSLGRGGSDLTAVVLAAALGAERCELIKDVAGYYAADPKLNPTADHIPDLDYERSLAMADEGCGLVQRAALEAARAHRLPIVVRSIGASHGSVLSEAAHAADPV